MKHNLFPHSWRVQIIPLPSWQKISLKKTNKREPIAEYLKNRVSGPGLIKKVSSCNFYMLPKSYSPVCIQV